ncbi:MAG: hypothetical protein EPO41_23630 [Reyranella sp.]|nr:MAG: hypothetical protein EPO41_23630 [Reyranella sp.]
MTMATTGSLTAAGAAAAGGLAAGAAGAAGGFAGWPAGGVCARAGPAMSATAPLRRARRRERRS